MSKISIAVVCLVAFLASLLMVSADPAPFQQCTNNPVFIPQSLDITPAKPKAGDTLVAVASVGFNF